jgi:hypothetical protein
VPLQEFHQRVDEIGKEDGKNKDQNDIPSKINSNTPPGNEQYRQSDYRGAAIGKCHFVLRLNR